MKTVLQKQTEINSMINQLTQLVPNESFPMILQLVQPHFTKYLQSHENFIEEIDIPGYDRMLQFRLYQKKTKPSGLHLLKKTNSFKSRRELERERDTLPLHLCEQEWTEMYESNQPVHRTVSKIDGLSLFTIFLSNQVGDPCHYKVIKLSEHKLE